MLIDFSITRWTPEHKYEKLSSTACQSSSLTREKLVRELRFKKARWNSNILSHSTKVNHKSLLKIPIISPSLPCSVLKRKFSQNISGIPVKDKKMRDYEIPSVSSGLVKCRMTFKCLKSVMRKSRGIH